MLINYSKTGISTSCKKGTIYVPSTVPNYNVGSMRLKESCLNCINASKINRARHETLLHCRYLCTFRARIGA